MLYFEHLQSVYPLFRYPTGNTRPSMNNMSPRLKMAICCLVSRFAEGPPAAKLPSPSEFARRAKEIEATRRLDVAEVKASFLLCCHSIAESLCWESLAELGRVKSMASLLAPQYTEIQTRLNVSPVPANDAEEWRNLWWSICDLETSCNALT